MFEKPVSTALLLLLGSSAPVFAAAGSEGGPAPAAARDAGLVQLAQRQVEVYVDQFGREVLVDPYTGEVVGIVGQSASRVPPPPPPPPPPDPYGDYAREPYYDREPPGYDPYEEERRLRRERRLRELGRYPGGEPGLPEYRDYRVEPDYVPVVPDPTREPAPQPEPEIAAPAPLEDDDSITRLPLEDPLSSDGDDAAAGLSQSVPQLDLDDDDPFSLDQPDVDLNGASEAVAAIQIVLDRYGASPGVIDGRMGDNVNKAIDVYRAMRGRALRTYDKDTMAKLLEETGGPAFVEYEITPVDVAGPYIASVPEDYGEKAKLDALGYTSVIEMLAERFHMDENFLRALNPGVRFDRPGTIIRVANVEREPKGKVTRIVADKSKEQVRGYDEDGTLVVAYPATIGSQSTPSPEGTHKVERIALDPQYTYNPEINFQQGDNDEVLTIPPGPNGPVGSVWIALSKPTYGIHGTPEPSKIGKTYSNGCVRLTNWDAQELAKLVEPGVTVEFME